LSARRLPDIRAHPGHPGLLSTCGPRGRRPDAVGNPTEVKNPRGYTTETDYDALDRPIQTTAPLTTFTGTGMCPGQPI